METKPQPPLPNATELLLDGFLHESAGLETARACDERLFAGCASAARPRGGWIRRGEGVVVAESAGGARGKERDKGYNNFESKVRAVGTLEYYPSLTR